MQIEATSPGESLWYALRAWYAANGSDMVETGMSWSDSDGRLGQFVVSTVISTTCVQLVSRARAVLANCLERDPNPDSSIFRETVVDAVKQYCVDPMGMSFADPMIKRFSDHAFRCADIARRSISARSRNNALRQAAVLSAGSIMCYCCGGHLGSWVKDSRQTGDIALDHLWPKAFGGVSTEENLLPVCAECNGFKMDRVSWDVFGVVQDYAFADHGSSGRLLIKLALHRRAAVRLAEQSNTTLKEAFIKLGPFQSLEMVHPDGGTWFFNHTAHKLSVLPSLW